MPPYLSPLHIAKPTLPPTCEPANEFLYHLSAFFGTCSIVSWLFAQLPQIYKNHKLKSTSGLSAFFLTEWLLGDVTNLLGCLFTGQASWQIIIAGYYVFVDCCLCAQWVWDEMLHHGRPPAKPQAYGMLGPRTLRQRLGRWRLCYASSSGWDEHQWYKQDIQPPEDPPRSLRQKEQHTGYRGKGCTTLKRQGHF